MKATELRIGNKLQKDNGEIFTISRLDESEDVLVKEERGLLTLGYNLIGIPLTEEILLKCGFKRRFDLEDCNLYDFENYEEITKLGINRGQGFMCLANFIEKHGFWIDLQTRATIEYLHQLQNLYFALTGQELEINL